MPASAAATTASFRSVLFDGLAPRQIAEILGTASVRSFRKGTQIQSQGHSARRLLLMRSGCARFFARTPEGNTVPLCWAGPGDPIGGMAILFRQTSYLIGCEALADSECYCWEGNVFREYLALYPRMTQNAIHVAAGYVEWLVDAYTALAVHGARERLADALLAYAHGLGVPHPDGVLVDVTNEDLAHTAQITKFTACRILTEWQRSRAISKDRGKILLRNANLLLAASKTAKRG